MKKQLYLQKFRIVLLVVLSVLVADVREMPGQEASWTAFTTDNDEFGASVPPETIVINEQGDYPQIVLSSQDVRLDIRISPNRGPADSALAIRPSVRDQGTQLQFELGKVVGQVNVSERPERYATVIYASSKKYSYFIGSYARVPDHPKVKQFLASLRFGGTPLMNIAGNPHEVPANPQKLADIPSSPIVKQFLKIPVNKKSQIRFEPIDRTLPTVVHAEGGVDLKKVTRSLIILRNPKPEYRPSGLYRSGSVTVQVTLLANGQVGTIIADPTSDRGMAESAASAARQIKFIPAEVEGKPIDVTRLVVYAYMAR